MRLSSILGVLAGLALPFAAHAGTGDEVWSYDAAGRPDESKIADVDGDGKKEIAVIVNGGIYTWPPVYENGSVALLDSAGTERWTFSTGKDFQGYPGVADIDGDGHDEIIACETDSEGMCYALDGDGSVLWSQGPYFWPSLWTMGPEVADVDMDGALEVVVPTYGGTVAVLDAATGQIEFEYDAWTNDGELFYGGAAIGNIDDDPQPEIVTFGWERGQVIAIDGVTGEAELVSQSLYEQYGNASWGNTPVLADLDADGVMEIVTTSFGWDANAATYALNGEGDILWRVEAMDQLIWVGPGVGDTDEDGYPEIYVQDAGGNLCRHEEDGAVTKVRSFGNYSWVEPLVVDASADLKPDVIGGDFDRLDMVNGTDLSEIYSYERGGAGHWAPILADIDLDGELELISAGWLDYRYVAIDTGLLAGGQFPTGDLASDLRALAVATDNMAALAQGDAAKELEKAADELWKAAEKAVSENLDKVFKAAFKSIKHLEGANDSGASAGHILKNLFLIANGEAQNGAERATAMGDAETATNISDAMGDAAGALEGPDYEEAAKDLQGAFKDLQKVEYTVSDCPLSPSHDRLARECRSLDAAALTADIAADSDTPKKARERLDKAAESMQKVAEELASGDREKAVQAAKEALKQLDEAIKHGGDEGTIGAAREQLFGILRDVAKRTLGSGQLVMGTEDPKVVEAEAELAKAEALYAEGDYQKAMDALKKAIKF